MIGSGLPEDTYFAARAVAKAGQRDNALSYLNELVDQAGFANVQKLVTDTAFESLHGAED